MIFKPKITGQFLQRQALKEEFDKTPSKNKTDKHKFIEVKGKRRNKSKAAVGDGSVPDNRNFTATLTFESVFTVKGRSNPGRYQ